jgi:hypothetical protein
MDLDASMIYLGPKALSSSLGSHSQGPRIDTYCSKPPNDTYIINHRPMIPLGSHVLLVETVLALNGWLEDSFRA